MAESNQLNTAWLAELTNPQHDGTTQQIYDFASAFTTDNARYLAKVAALNQCRQSEDNVWLTVQRDPASKSLEGADKLQDAYVNAARYINLGYTSLPDSEAQKAEAVECEQIFKDYKFSTRDPYGAEADKIIQMQQNFQEHEAFLTQIGAWQWYTKAVAAAQDVRLYLGQRALAMGEFVKGEMKAARRATDLAIADLYRTIEAMDELMPSTELTALITQLKGIELYARQYILKEGGNQGGGTSTNPSQEEENGGTEQGGDDNGGETPPSGGDDNGGGETPPAGGDDNGGGDNNGGGGNNPPPVDLN